MTNETCTVHVKLRDFDLPTYRVFSSHDQAVRFAEKLRKNDSLIEDVSDPLFDTIIASGENEAQKILDVAKEWREDEREA